jgi:hypothetical protein
MEKCECGSDDLELIAKILVTEVDLGNNYSEGIYLCKICLSVIRYDGIDVDAEDISHHFYVDSRDTVPHRSKV